MGNIVRRRRRKHTVDSLEEAYQSNLRWAEFSMNKSQHKEALTFMSHCVTCKTMKIKLKYCK